MANSILNDALKMKHLQQKTKTVNSQKIYKVLESAETMDVNVEEGVIVIDNINEKAPELDAVLANYEMGYSVSNILNLIKTDFNVSLIFNINEDASEVDYVNIIIADVETVVKVMNHFAQFSAGTTVDISTDSEDDVEYINIKLFNTESMEESVEEE